MKHGSLFSGIGGFDLAAQWMGWTNEFHCEINPFGQKILKYYWPDATTYSDITKTDFSIWRGEIDILTGGFPCQPYSIAGKRKGKDDERHLWPEMLRAIREISPRWIVGENVRGLINWNGGMVFDEVQADLEVEGYEVLPFLLPASGIGAEHERYRCWFIAYSNTSGKGLQGFNFEWQTKQLQYESAQSILSNSSIFERYKQKRGGYKHLRNGDGLSLKLSRECIKAIGNSVHPKLVCQIFKAIEQYESI